VPSPATQNSRAHQSNSRLPATNGARPIARTEDSRHFGSNGNSGMANATFPGSARNASVDFQNSLHATVSQSAPERARSRIDCG
jgi:hypothetical protein